MARRAVKPSLNPVVERPARTYKRRASKTTLDFKIELRSSLPTRERWNVGSIRNKPNLAVAVQTALMAEPGVVSVVVNPLSGRILLLYGVPVPVRQGEALILGALSRLRDADYEVAERSSEKSPFLSLVLMANPNRKLLLYAVATSVLSTLGNFAIAWCTSSLLGAVAKKGTKASGLRAGPWTFGVVTALTSVAAVVVRYFQNRFWKVLSTSVEHQLRVKAFAHLEGLDMAYFDGESTPALMNLITGDLNNVARFIESGPGSALEAITSILVALALLLAVAPGIALISVLPMAVVFTTYRYAQRLLGPKYGMMAYLAGGLNAVLTNNLSGIATVKSFTAERYESTRVRELSDQVRRSAVEAADGGSAYASLQGGIYGTVAAFALALGGTSVEDGSLSSGAFLTLAQLVPRLMSAIGSLNDLYDLYQNASSSSERVLALLNRDATIRNGKRRLPAAKVRGEIVFDDVRFGYQPGFEVLKGLSLKIAAGQTVGIVGSTGAGKTTLAKLLLRFYEAGSGSVEIDGMNVKDLSVEDLRRAVGFVSQDVYLFDGTVKENILYGSPNATLEEMVAATKAAEAEDFIKQLPYGYDTPVGERGIRLSTGQRQRISIARAILKDAPVLVLDEATASVDNETEASIHRSIERLEAGRSMIIIAHRLSTVRNADRIYVLQSGKILEQGKHDELLARNGLYASLWNVQTGSKRESAQSATG